MKRLASALLCLAIIFAYVPAASAQTVEFALTPGRVGEEYRQNLPLTLRDKYGMSVAGGSGRSGITWVLAGRLPEGLDLNPADGTITGVPAPQEGATYKFRVRVTDAEDARAMPLSLSFTIRIQPARLRLVPDNSLRLVPNGEAGALARNAHPSRRRAAAPTAVPATFAPSPRNAAAAARAESGGVNAGSSAATASVECGEIEIETARKSSKQEIPVTFIVKSDLIKSLDIVVRGEQMTSFAKRVSVPAGAGDGSPAEISELIRLMAGENTIAVSGLDERRRSVGCGEKVVMFMGAPDQADNAERADAGGNGSGVHATAQPQTAGPRAERASRFTAILPAQGENAALASSVADADPQATPTPPQDPRTRLLPDNVTRFVTVWEDKGDKELQPLYEADSHRVRAFANRESTIVVKLSKVGEESPADNTKFVVSAEIPGKNPLQIDGESADAASSRSQTRVFLLPGSSANINLSGLETEPGDQLKVRVERMTDNATTSVGERTFFIELGNYNLRQGVSPSLFLLSRPGVSASDMARTLQADMPTTNNPTPAPVPVTDIAPTDINNPVSYTPSPGFNYMFSYKPKPDKGGGWKFLSLMEPGLGINATFTDFNDQTLSLENALQRIRDRDSDVQLGVGGVASFFGNAVHLTYGANLNVEKQRGYFGFGIDVLKVINIVRPD